MKALQKLFALLLLFLGASIPNYTYAQCTAVPGSIVQTPDGQQRVYTCPGDGNADIVQFSNNTSSSANYAYVITDNTNTILAVNVGDQFDFEPAGTGTCRVFGFSYNGTITAQPGDLVYTTRFSDDCWYISNNAIEVVRDEADGGTVSIANGGTSYYACLGDGNPDIVAFTNSGASGSNYAYVITDDNNKILALPSGNFANFANAPAGICRVWGLAYTGMITAQAGDNAAAVALSDGCFDLSDNYIEVIRNSVDGGQVAMPSGEVVTNLCTGDGVADVVNFTNNSSSTADYAYVVTDGNNNILAINVGTSFDFDIAPAGVCRVFGFSYTGNIMAQAGDLVYSTRFSDGCYLISSNAITVYRENVDGGTVAMPSGATTRYTCPGDGNDDIVMFTHTTNSNANYAYVITDDNNNILGLPPANSQNFEGAGEGVCRVWGLSYTGNITAQPGDNAAAVALSDDCFDLSDNFIEIMRSNPEGGTVSLLDNSTSISVCVGDGIDDVLEFAHSTGSGARYAYVITDDNNNILGLPSGNSQNFEGAGVGTCRVWGLSYTGTITAEAGDNAAQVDLSNDCFELSTNFIEVRRETCFTNPGTSGFSLSQANEQILSTLQLAPNPVVETLEVRFENDALDQETGILQVYSLSGQLQLEQQIAIDRGVNNVELAVEQLASGLYFVRLQGSAIQVSKRFVKQ